MTPEEEAELTEAFSNIIRECTLCGNEGKTHVLNLRGELLCPTCMAKDTSEYLPDNG